MASKILSALSAFPPMNSPAGFCLVLAAMAGCTPNEGDSDDADTPTAGTGGRVTGVAGNTARGGTGSGSTLGSSSGGTRADGGGGAGGAGRSGSTVAGAGGSGQGDGGSGTGLACEVEDIVDQLWWNGDTCPSGVCRNLLLRSDGTYQTSTIVRGTLVPGTFIPGTLAPGSGGSVFCDHGVWPAAEGGCGSLELASCDQPSRSVEWALTDDGLLFGGVNYTRYTLGTDESPFFTGCTVRRLCAGITCSEVLECLTGCVNAVVETPQCPGNCLARIAPEYTAQLDALSACIAQSGCGDDDACSMQQCAAEFQSCR